MLALLAAMLVYPAIVMAHAKLLRSNPAAGASLAAPPAMVHLVFSERPSVALSSLKLVGANGDTIVLTGLRSEPDDKNTLVADVPSNVGGGKWRIVWRVAASDGHPKIGTIDFTILGQAVAAPVAVDTSPPQSSATTALTPDTEEGQPMAIGGALGTIGAKWLSFLAIFALIGVVAFKFGVLNRMGASDADTFGQIASTNAAALGMGASGAVLVAAALKLAKESSTMPDVPISTMLFESAWGLAIFLEMIAAVAAAVAFRAAHSANGSSRATGWRAAQVAALVLAVTPALSGHAASTQPVFVSVVADMIHVLAGSVWLGTLGVIVVVGISAALKTPDATRPGARVASLINTFSPMALICGGLVVSTGVIAALFHLPHVRALWTTPYGVALSLKLLFVLFLFGAGAWNWRRMKPRLTGDNAVVPMRSMATFELLLATIVLGITAILVALELP